MKASLYLMLWVVASALIVSAVQIANTFESSWRHGYQTLNAAQLVFKVNAAFFGSLFGSLVTYRVFEHPLRGFPGPRLAAVSKLWHFCHVFNISNNLLLDRIHRRYGNIVRTGPQELTIVDPGVWQLISGPGTSCIKGPWYDMLFPYISLNSIRTKDSYAPRRKRWDEALSLSATSILDKETRIRYFASLFVQQLHISAQRPINITSWFYHFSFDFIGDFAFGDSFSLIANLNSETEPHHAPSLISNGMSVLQFLTPIPWAGQLCFSLSRYIPLLSKDWNRALAWAVEMCNARLLRYDSVDGKLEMGVNRNEPADAFSRFISSAYHDDDDALLDRPALYGDAFNIVVAGSHTVALTLTMLFYELSRRPNVQDNLRAEITAASSSVASSIGKKRRELAATLETLPFLNGCINEILRLYPGVPTGGIRQTVDKGMKLGEHWIPPRTVIVAPRWSIGRLESAFENPDDFVPERWTTKPDMVKDRRAFNPFGIGRHNCPGKGLGLMEVRIVVLWSYPAFHVRLFLQRKMGFAQLMSLKTPLLPLLGS
ncbi:cytochrome P450 [Xylariaceae sp. FL0662B]|nr:cytochrome P450 [Xylariaceae sp. FL0662B]